MTKSTTEVNGLTSQFFYDGFDRLNKTIMTDWNRSETSFIFQNPRIIFKLYFFKIKIETFAIKGNFLVGISYSRGKITVFV